MTNDEALDILVAKRSTVNAAINGLNEYRTQSENWKDSVSTAKMTEVKSTAADVGADIDAWDGSDPV
jgi:predicted phage-related endonuclease